MTANQQLHGTAIAYGVAGLLLVGISGSGKSTLAAAMLQQGAELIGDDQLILTEASGYIQVAPAPTVAGVLELRGLGLISMPHIAQHALHLVVELTMDAEERLPTPQTRTFLGIDLPAIQVQPVPYTSASSLLLYLKAMQEGRMLPQDWHPKG
jgi:serine kinase of HPr protein (carbohydrate metabolism regulator)